MGPVYRNLGGMVMANERNMLLGVLAIILGILVIAFPLISIFTASVLAGLGIMFLGIWLFVKSFETWSMNKGMGAVQLILGILAIIVGIGLFGSILVFSFLVSFWLYFAGFFLIISGIFSLTGAATANKGAGGIGIILGILYIILAFYAINPFYLAILIGIWLIIDGIALFFVSPEQLMGGEVKE